MITVKVSTPAADGMREIQTEATTWGELKSDLLDAGISTDGMKGVVRETKVSLEASDAQLPDTDFTVMLFTGKIKSGFDHAEMMRALRDNIENAYNEVIDDIESGLFDDGENDSCERTSTVSSLEQERRKIERELGA